MFGFNGIDLFLMLAAIVLVLGAQGLVTSRFNKYKKVKNARGLTGAQAAEMILASEKVAVAVVATKGFLGDHYDPTKKTIGLSKDVYGGASVAAVAIAAHECGHAVQDRDNYSYLRLRNKILPLTQIASVGGYVAILIGIIFSFGSFIWLGIIAEVVILIFQLITLPVEFDASRRAMVKLENLGLLSGEEPGQARKVLQAAALTYVAAVAAALLQILRLVLIARDN